MSQTGAQPVAPTGEERTFGVDEVIVSKTDLRGRLTYVNDVFCRVSAMEEVDLLGRPHNVIRHPAMPRGVFKLLWDTITARQELFAYVLNLAADGAHYWVLAHVTPSLDRHGEVVGYHSNRRLPSRDAIRRIEPIYERMLEAESHHAKATDAAQAGYDALAHLLAEQRATYDEFVWALTTRSAA